MPAVPAIPTTPATPPVRAHNRTAKFVLWIIATAAVLGGGGYFLYRSLVSPPQDPLIAQLFRHPVPLTKLPEWKVEPLPSLLANKEELHPGEIGTVGASLRGSGDSSATVLLSVFKTPADAKNSNDLVTKKIAANLPPGTVTAVISGGLCYGSETVIGSCRAVIGRTVVFLIFTPALSASEAAVTMKTITDYVSPYQ